MYWYTIYDPSTDRILALGTAADCALALGISLRTLQKYLSGSFRAGYCPYDIAVENLSNGNFSVYHARAAAPPLKRRGARVRR